MTKAKASRRRPPSSKKVRARNGRPGAWLAAHLGRQADDVWGLVLMVAGVLAALGIFADLTGPVGRAVRQGSAASLGWGRVLVPVTLCGVGAVLVRGRLKPPPGGRRDSVPVAMALGFGFLTMASCGLLHLVRGGSRGADRLDDAGGFLGAALAEPLRSALALWGATIVLVTLGGVAVLILTRTSVRAASGRATTLVVGVVPALRSALGSAGRWLTAIGHEDEIEATAGRHPSTGAPGPEHGPEPEPAAVVEPGPPELAPVEEPGGTWLDDG
ncbi:MAG: DNA translocase FtsK 4TM domain-containing protein, partial [Actinomycetota bacterium]|nr:DNA translocase FtsK 4TM domain-containing protein [Actinomycetota bacterium]